MRSLFKGGLTLVVRNALRMVAFVAALFLLCASPTWAATCSQAVTQGTAPSGWQTYCWLDFISYSDATARTASGQDFSFTLSDGATLTLNVKVSGGLSISKAAPSWSGAAVGNTAFIGIPGRPILYQDQNGVDTVVTISNILITPPSGTSAVTAYAFVAADAESTDGSEQISFVTNGGAWTELDKVNPISGTNYPTVTGLNTQTVTESGGGVAGNTGSWIFGSTSPTTITTTLKGSGLQGAMFAVRFASLRLNKVIGGARINSADQFTFDIVSTSSSAILATGTSTGSGNGPFTAAAVSLASGIPLTITETMASGSVSALSKYQSKLNCTNANTGSATAIPTNLTTTSHSIGALQFGDSIECTFTNSAYPHISLAKALATSRRFSTDQFTVQINSGGTTIASATTSGTTNVVSGGNTGLTQVTAGSAYTLTEIAASGSLSQYTYVLACTNANTSSTTVLPTTVGGTITPALGDVITCTITNSRRSGNGTLTVVKFSTPVSDPINGTVNPKMIPGAIVRYTITVFSTGNQSISNGTIVITDPLPSNVTYDGGSAVQFTNGAIASGLSTFNASTMVTFSSQTGGGSPFTYTPTSGYDPNVKGVRIAPTGTMSAASAAGQPSFSVSFFARIN